MRVGMRSCLIRPKLNGHTNCLYRSHYCMHESVARQYDYALQFDHQSRGEKL